MSFGELHVDKTDGSKSSTGVPLKGGRGFKLYGF